MNKNRIPIEQKSNIKRQKNQIPNEKSIKYQIDIFETNGLPYTYIKGNLFIYLLN